MAPRHRRADEGKRQMRHYVMQELGTLLVDISEKTIATLGDR